MGEAKTQAKVIMSQTKLLNLIRKKYKESIPALPQNYYSDFDENFIHQACLEYLEIHNFGWRTRVYAQLDFTPTVAKDYLLSDFPGDMASAFSTKAFKGWYTSVLVNFEEETAEVQMRRFCYVVCGLGKAVQILSKEMPTPMSPEELLALALVLTGCKNNEV